MPNENKLYLEGIHNIPDQFEVAYTEAYSQKYPFEYYGNISEIVVAGMGGSAFGGLVAKTVFSKEKLLSSLDVVSDYDLPSYADEKTLVVATSYSGTTEETLSVFHQALSRGCKLIVISSGGELIDLAIKHKIPFYKFDSDTLNPAKAPRVGIGYIVGATLGVLSKLELLIYDPSVMMETSSFMKSFLEVMKAESKLPLQLSQKFVGRLPIFVCAEHLTSATHIWRNFLNETAKHISFMYEIPNMNHHFLDGLGNPDVAKNNVMFIYLKSNLYHERNRRRMDITREVTKKQGYYDISLTLESGNYLNEVFELVLIGCLVSYNLAEVHGVNPSSNEYVDFLKSSLKG